MDAGESKPPCARGDIIAVRGFRLLTFDTAEALVHYERPVELAAALQAIAATPFSDRLRGERHIREALRLCPHLWVRRKDILALTRPPAL